MSTRNYEKTFGQVLWNTDTCARELLYGPPQADSDPIQASVAPSLMNGSFPARSLPLRLSPSGRERSVELVCPIKHR